MMKKIKTIIPVIMSLSIATVFSLPAKVNASEEASVVSLQVGSALMKMNGVVLPIEKPYIDDGSTLVPLRAITEAFGAEVTWKENGLITLTYRDTTIELTIGNELCKVNNQEEQLPLAPVLMNGTTMVPLRYLAEKLGAKVVFDEVTQEISIVIEDDGALKDLSFLTGGIGNMKVGSSYFGWKIDIPKGSQISNNSVKSIFIKNEQRKLNIGISVSMRANLDLKDYYHTLKESPGKINTGKLMDSSLVSQASPAYAEFAFRNYIRGASLVRVYMSDQYIYTISLSSSEELDYKKMKENPFYQNILNSFQLGYSGGSNDVKDFSDAAHGFVKHEGYIMQSYRSSMSSWSMKILPEWEKQKIGTSDLTNERVGLNGKEYIQVDIAQGKGIEDLSSYGDEIIKNYNHIMNPKYYKFIEKKMEKLSGNDLCKIVYEVELGGKKYIMDENILKSGNLLYRISMKLPAEKYRSEKEKYYKMLESFEVTAKSTSTIEAKLRLDEASKNKVGNSDQPVDYTNKNPKWSMKIPGYWYLYDEGMDFSDRDGSYSVFLNPKNNAFIFVMAGKNSAETNNISDADRIELIENISNSKEIKLVKKELMNDKGGTVQAHTYHIAAENEGLFSTISYYELKTDQYTYFFIFSIDDLYTTDPAIKELQDIWKSFEIR